MNSHLHNTLIKICTWTVIAMVLYSFLIADVFLFIVSFSSLALFVIGSAIKHTVDKRNE